MAALVTLEQAAAHLRLDMSPDEDATDLETKLADATATVIDYLKKPDHGWTAETVPGPVRAAIMLVLGAMWSNREGLGGAGTPQMWVNPISPSVEALLARHRDPALA